MIPAAFVARHRLPSAPAREPGRDPNTDVERDQVRAAKTPPAMAGARLRRRPTTAAEAGLSALWAGLLHREQVGLDDDFFALGGNSLLAAEMLARTRATFGVSADSVRPLTRCLLRDPTLRGFAAAVEDARAGELSADGDQPEIDFAGDARLGLKIRRDGAPSRPRPDSRQPARHPAHRGDRVPRRAPAERAGGRHQRAHLVPGPGGGRGRGAAWYRRRGRAL